MTHTRRMNKSQQLLLRRVFLTTVTIVLVAITAATVYAALKRVATTSSRVAVTAAPMNNANVPAVTMQKAPSGLPTRLSIPSIGVDAVIAPAGLTTDGTMDIQKDPDQVGWYKFGTRPGDEGSAVIAGHSGWTGKHGSVFNNLSALKPGDEMSVVDQKGIVATFTVREAKQYDPNADAEFIFMSYDGKAHLNLITCEGAWVNATQSFTHRLVVFADLKKSKV